MGQRHIWWLSQEFEYFEVSQPACVNTFYDSFMMTQSPKGRFLRMNPCLQATVFVLNHIYGYILNHLYISINIFLENKLFIKMLVSWHQDKKTGSYTRESVKDTYVGSVYLPGNPDALRWRGLQVNFLRWTVRSCRNQKHRGRLYTPEADSFLL